MSLGRCIVAEGFATAATIHEATSRPCVVAYSASNLVPVTASSEKSMAQHRIS
jgi:putative DNA primase/helicase